MKHIAFISTLSDVHWGGSEALWAQAALCLKERGHSISANIQWWPQPHKTITQLTEAGIAIHQRRQSLAARLRAKVTGAHSNAHLNWLDDTKPDGVVISLHCQNNGLGWMIACAKRNIPTIILVHAVVEHWWPGDDQQKKLAEAYNQAAALFFVSNRNHQQTCTQLADALPNARIVRNPFNVSYDAAPEWPGGETLRLACVGRMDPGNKGQDTLLHALSGERWRERDFELTFYGEGPHSQSILALRDYLSLQDKVIHGGFTGNVEKIWESHHALALTSRAEGLPIVIVEAMLCGRPCVVTDVAGNAELMKDNISGFVAGAPTIAAVEEALERLWQSWQVGQLKVVGQNAAVAIRREIPKHPAAVFADEIQTILSV